MAKNTRSFLKLAFLAALNRPPAPEMHIHGALCNGLAEDEIMEVFMQVAIHSGVPAGADCVRAARKAFAKDGVR